MKRFLVFAGDHYEAGGGWNDFDSAHETAEEAIARCKELTDGAEGQFGEDWGHCVDLELMKEINDES